ncbi:hypothetical protein K488DRAFT_48701 [Vararia minispora EC-137]|uniref:Uncharacterized protein n=1 Tax=Vararia minispora EC-137 TaxID=1314806 RepID=A0ACB8QMR9_9AGAM|nr:hypothetical protein K488DRAFT_48701 [Vararia minispora EC-137]
MLDENLRINGFLFCIHGHEYCNHCQRDHRNANDDELAGETRTVELDYTDPDAVADAIMPRTPPGVTQRIPGEYIWACKEHRISDCKSCFDWPKLLRQTESRKYQWKTGIEDRNVTLGLLSSMRIELPGSTKLSTEILGNKLTSALNLAQVTEEYEDKFPVNPNDLPHWNDGNVFGAIYRGTSKSIAEEHQYPAFSGNPVYEYAFMDVLQTMMNIEGQIGYGRTAFTLEDRDEQEALCIRILGVHHLANDTPLIMLSYLSLTSHEPITPLADFVKAQQKEVGSVVQLTGSRQAQAMLRQVLYLNSTRLAPAYKPDMRPYEKDFRVSFLLPLWPLSMVNIGKLAYKPGCVLCELESVSRCSSCQSANYCGSECQRAHWKEHKSFCRSLKGGIWRTLTFTNHFDVDGQRHYSVVINNGTGGVHISGKDGQPPANVHGNRTFLIKLQRPSVDPLRAHLYGIDTDKQGILLYDCTRSFSGQVYRETDPKAYEAILQEMLPGGEAKMYRWARRVGDWDLSVCLDRKPLEGPDW